MDINILWFWIFILWLFSIIIAILKDKIRIIFNFLINIIINYFSTKPYFYKRKGSEIQDEILDFIEPEKEHQEKVLLEYKYRKDLPFDWRIIKMDRNLGKERIEKSVILQVPQSSLFKKERNVMTKKQRDALFFVLNIYLTRKYGKDDVETVILDQVNELGINEEFGIFQKILSDKRKKFTLIGEMRRKWNSSVRTGAMGESMYHEFTRFIEDLSKGDVGSITIDNFVNKNVETYFLEFETLLNSCDTIHILARSLKRKTKIIGNFKLLDHLDLKIIEKYRKKLNIEHDNYDWVDEKGNIVYKARTSIIKKREKLRNKHE